MLMESIRAGVGEHCAMHTIVGNCYSHKDAVAALDELKPEILLIDYDVGWVVKLEDALSQHFAGRLVIRVTAHDSKHRKLKKLGLESVLIVAYDVAPLIQLLLDKTVG